MSAIHKILILIIAVQCFEVNGNPIFQGLSFQRSFEINFKPLEWKPIAFITEKWSPFGVFGKKYAVQKRSIDDIVPRPPMRVPRPAAPVFEHIEEIEQIGTEPFITIPKPVPEPPVSPPIPTVSSAPPKREISSPKPPVALPIIVHDPPPLHDKTPVVPPISTNMVIVQPKKVVNHHVSPTGLHTDISRVDSVKEYIHTAKPIHTSIPVPPQTVVPILKPPPPPTPAAPVSLPPVISSPPPPVVSPSPPPVVSASPPPPVSIPPPTAVSVPPPPAKPVPPPPPPTPVHPVPVKVPEPSAPHKVPELIVPPKAPEPVPPAINVEKEVKKEIPSPPEEPKNEILLKDSTFIRGSKMALQFGTVFLTLMAQFFNNARATIDIMTSPPPKV